MEPLTIPYSDWPRILILDDDVGRIELLQQRLYQNGYQTDTAGVAELESRAGPLTRLVLAYLPVPDAFTAMGVPVLVMDRPETLAGSAGNSATVSHLSSLAGFDVLLDRIDILIGPGAK